MWVPFTLAWLAALLFAGEEQVAPSLKLEPATGRGTPFLSVSPISGTWGTVVTIDVSPQVSEFSLNSATVEILWQGVYQPMVGSPTDPFSVHYSPAQIEVPSAWQAKIVMGAGVFTNAPSIDELDLAGVLSGTLRVVLHPTCNEDLNGDGIVNTGDLGVLVSTFGQMGPNLPGDINHDGVVSTPDLGLLLSAFDKWCWIEQTSQFAPAESGATLQPLYYPGPVSMGTAPVVLLDEQLDVPIYLLSLIPEGASLDEDGFLESTAFHQVVHFSLDEDPLTATQAPGSLIVDVISRNSMGGEIDRLTEVELVLFSPDDDPELLHFVSDIARPIVLTDLAVDDSGFTAIRTLLASPDGSIVVVPATTQ